MTNTIMMSGGADIFRFWQTWLAIALFGVAVTLFIRQAIRSYRLARRMLAGKKWPITRAWWCVFDAILGNPAHAWSRRKLFDLVRKRLEFMIFYPRPEWYWPLRDDDELYKGVAELNAPVCNRDEGKEQVSKAKAAARKRYKTEVSKWKQGLRTNRSNQVIILELAGELNDALSDVKLYFDTLKVLDPDPETPIEFLTPVQVKIGFIASQHLLTGLLVRYNEKWGDIINGFEADTRKVDPLIGRDGARNPALAQAALDFRQIQSFIYHCWLLWGPSVPVCENDCTGWEGTYTTLQYGYGDENNAIEIVGSRDYLYGCLCELMGSDKDGEKTVPSTEKFGKVMAIPASVRGGLQYSSIAQLGPDKVPEALRKSWDGAQDERPILRLSEKAVAAEDKRVGEAYDNYGKIGKEVVEDGVDANRSRYYSAYFWVMFVIHRRGSDDVWRPLHSTRDGEGSYELWKAGIPFFEHGNMADAASCRFAKQQLVEKALSGIVNLVDAWEDGAGKGTFPLRFSFACAIDDANCSKRLAVTALQGGETVEAMMKARLTAEANRPGSRIAELHKTGVIEFDAHHPVPPGALNYHAACTLSRDVTEHYKRLDKSVQEDAR